jgi:hypothetical protein
MSASPAATAVASPDGLTVTTDKFDERHVASAVIACVDPFVKVAVAVNWLVEPTVGLVPDTAMDVTVGVDGAKGADGVGEVLVEPEPHPHITSAARDV